MNIDVTIHNSLLELWMGAVNLSLEILEFSPSCPIDQCHIDGVVKLIKMIKLCRGKAYNPDFSYPPSASAPEDWGLIGSDPTHAEKRVRWKECKAVICVNAKSDTCMKCQHGQSAQNCLTFRHRRRVKHSPTEHKENCKYIQIFQC